MKNYSNILYNYDKNLLDLIITQNKKYYGTNSIIYADPYFIFKMIQRITNESNDSEKFKSDSGYIGRYIGNPIISMPNFIKNYSIIVPNTIKMIPEVLYEI